jgi:hypothetical protein
MWSPFSIRGWSIIFYGKDLRIFGEDFIFLLSFSFFCLFFFGCEKEKIDFVREGAVEDYLYKSLSGLLLLLLLLLLLSVK